jgi:hypothetical protein
VPVLIPILVGATVVGTTMGVVGQVKQGNAAKQSGEAAAQREEFNANVADVMGQDALARGDEETSLFRTQVRQLIGTQRAGFAAQNVEVGSGSAQAVQADTAYLGELDTQRIQANAAREAWGYQVEAQDRRLAAKYSRASGQAAATASRWAAGATALNGAGSLAATAYGWQRTGK